MVTTYLNCPLVEAEALHLMYTITMVESKIMLVSCNYFNWQQQVPAANTNHLAAYCFVIVGAASTRKSTDYFDSPYCSSYCYCCSCVYYSIFDHCCLDDSNHIYYMYLLAKTMSDFACLASTEVHSSNSYH